jgi:FAD-dependent sensor of blue light
MTPRSEDRGAAPARGARAPAAQGVKRKERDLVQIVYVSSAAAAMTPAELATLAENSRDRSDASRLTGLLLQHGEHFYGILEGPRLRVFRRIEEIIAEQGHRGVRILREEPIRVRRFANWSSGVLPALSAEASGPHEFLWRFCGLAE